MRTLLLRSTSTTTLENNPNDEQVNRIRRCSCSYFPTVTVLALSESNNVIAATDTSTPATNPDPPHVHAHVASSSVPDPHQSTLKQPVTVNSFPLYISSTIDIQDSRSTDKHVPKSQITETFTKNPASSSSSVVVLNLNPPRRPDFMDIRSYHPVLKSFLVGSVSGTCSTLLFQPLDLVKTRLQQTTPLRYAAASTSNGAAAVPAVGMFTLVGHIVRDEKIVGLWKGMTPALTRCVPGVGLYFASIHSLKIVFGVGPDPSALESVCLGVTGRCFSGVAMIPFTVVKTRFESQHYQYSSIRSAISTIYSQEGWKGLTSGLAATLLRDAPFSGLYLLMYTSIKRLVPNEYWNLETTSTSSSLTSPSTIITTTTTVKSAFAPYLRFSCGLIAGLAASIATQPADVIKTKLQLFPSKFSSIPSVVVYVYQRYGLAGYFKGLVPRMMRRTLVAAMSWTIYEQLMSSIGLT